MTATQISLNDRIEATLTASGFYGLEVIGGEGNTTGANVHPRPFSLNTPDLLGKVTSILRGNGLTVEPRAGYLYVTNRAASRP